MPEILKTFVLQQFTLGYTLLKIEFKTFYKGINILSNPRLLTNKYFIENIRGNNLGF